IDEMSTKAINESISEVMLGTVNYDDLIHIVTDGNGKITMLQANSIVINTLTQEVVKKTYNSLFNRLYDPLYIPLGSFSGIPAFSNWGPIISIEISPYGNVNCKFISEFKTGGINQTIHKIYALVDTKVSVVLPLNKLVCENSAEVLICESLIIGDIPDTYLMAEEKGDLLNMAG
ncbi:MAG: sporulation protein YunB, partial [Clostridia bacterium]|nr:sporulation protein YunB [Clostridia bacterium]